jgi:polyisoprenoid-binding protein YceI
MIRALVTGSFFTACFGLALASLSGCDDKKDGPKLAPSASALASSVPPPSAMATRFTIDPKSETSLMLEAPDLTIKAKTSAAAGALDIDLKNSPNSRGEVKIDLSTIVMSTYGTEKDKTQTVHARTWLEVADGEEGKLDEKVKDQNRYAVYAIRSIESPSATDVTTVAPVRDGADEVRTVTMTTKGELLVHGRKVDREGLVEVGFRYDPGAAADKPKAITVKSKKPFRVVLAEHDVKPRDGFGKIAKGSFNLLGTKVAENADISLDLRAKPQS